MSAVEGGRPALSVSRKWMFLGQNHLQSEENWRTWAGWPTVLFFGSQNMTRVMFYYGRRICENLNVTFSAEAGGNNLFHVCSSQRLAQFSFGGLMGSKRNVFAFKCSRSVILTRRYRMFLTCWSSLRGLSPGQDTCWWFAAVITESASVCVSSTWKWAPVIASFLFSDFLLHTGLLRPQSLFYILHVSVCPSHTSGSATARCCFWKSRNAQRSEARM